MSESKKQHSVVTSVTSILFTCKKILVGIHNENQAQIIMVSNQNELPGSWLVDGSDASSLCCPDDSMSVWLSREDSIPGLENTDRSDEA